MSVIAHQLVFDYDQLDTETRIVVQQRTGEIRERIRQTAQGIVEIGQRLLDVKERLPHGQFGPWLRAEFDMTDGHARKMMQVAKSFGDQNDHYDRFAPTALYLLAAPATPDEAREEALARAEAGETISPRAAEQIIAAHTQPDPDDDDDTPLTPYEQQVAAQYEQRLQAEAAEVAARAALALPDPPPGWRWAEGNELVQINRSAATGTWGSPQRAIQAAAEIGEQLGPIVAACVARNVYTFGYQWDVRRWQLHKSGELIGTWDAGDYEAAFERAREVLAGLAPRPPAAPVAPVATVIAPDAEEEADAPDLEPIRAQALRDLAELEAWLRSRPRLAALLTVITCETGNTVMQIADGEIDDPAHWIVGEYRLAAQNEAEWMESWHEGCQARSWWPQAGACWRGVGSLWALRTSELLELSDAEPLPDPESEEMTYAQIRAGAAALVQITRNGSADDQERLLAAQLIERLDEQAEDLTDEQYETLIADLHRLSEELSR